MPIMFDTAYQKSCLDTDDYEESKPLYCLCGHSDEEHCNDGGDTTAKYGCEAGNNDGGLCYCEDFTLPNEPEVICEPVYFGQQNCKGCDNVEMIETSVEPQGVWEVSECNYCWQNNALQSEFIRPEKPIETRQTF